MVTKHLQQMYWLRDMHLQVAGLVAFFDHMAMETTKLSFCYFSYRYRSLTMHHVKLITHHASRQVEEEALFHMRNALRAYRLSSPGTNCFLAKDPTPSAAITMSPWYFFSPYGVSAVIVTPDSLCCNRATLWLKSTAPSGKALMSSRCRSLQCILQR